MSAFVGIPVPQYFIGIITRSVLAIVLMKNLAQIRIPLRVIEFNLPERRSILGTVLRLVAGFGESQWCGGQ
jgi:hypothetical protein